MLGRATRQFAALIRFSKPLFKPFFTRRYLMMTNTVTSGFLMGAADIIQQSLERRQKPTQNWNADRMVNMFITGCAMGPLLHYWYYWIDKIIPGKDVNGIKPAIIKVTIDQVFAPFFGGWYFITVGLLQGQSLVYSWNEFIDKFWDYYIAEIYVWTAAQMLNFLFVPPTYRVLFVNIVTLGWNVYLSYIKHKH
ncbi:mpv17-like protein 2 [Hemicordylus capensis]|uniref:mpv17-like protein 2 n=1 Tax=Hemicordylus capensis TaxID=884348 RepID=UPI002304CF54|nr:mpv17-like protein 2 [Hemicordylus capensis]